MLHIEEHRVTNCICLQYPTSPYHIHTQHTHTCAQTWLLKVLTWAMPVSPLSCGETFHLPFSKSTSELTVEFLSTLCAHQDIDWIKGFHLYPAPTLLSIRFHQATLIMQRIIQSQHTYTSSLFCLTIIGLISALALSETESYHTSFPNLIPQRPLSFM